MRKSECGTLQASAPSPATSWPGTPKMVFIGCQKRNVVAVPAVARENRPPDGRPPGITYLRRNSKGGGLVELLYAGTGFMHIQRLLQDGT